MSYGTNSDKTDTRTKLNECYENLLLLINIHQAVKAFIENGWDVKTYEKFKLREHPTDMLVDMEGDILDELGVYYKLTAALRRERNA